MKGALYRFIEECRQTQRVSRQTGVCGQPQTEHSGSQTSPQISEITSKICILTSIPGNSYPTEVLDAIALMSCLGK